MNSEHKFLNYRISVEFYNKLMSHKAFQDNWKAISPAFYFLQRIATLNDMANGKPVPFHSITIKNLFYPYRKKTELDFAYRRYIRAMIELGLLTVNDEYIIGDNETVEGYCKEYYSTSEAVDLLASSNIAYLKSLHTNKNVIYNNNKNIARRQPLTYSDYVLDYIQDGLNHFDYNYDQAMAMITGSEWKPETQLSAQNSLINFKTKEFGELSYNETDGRVWNEFVGMKSNLRKTFTYKNMTRQAVIDIRSCHPTFFSTFLLDYYITHPTPNVVKTDIIKKTNFPSSLPPSLQPPIPSTMLGINGESVKIMAATADIIENQAPNTTYTYVDTYSSITIKELKEEHERWVKLFTDRAIDPRDVIGAEIGRTKDEVKKALNESINGTKQYTRLLKWIETNFPCLYQVWQTTDISQTGCNISKMYESKIMLNKTLYEQTERQQLKITYEYDGISVFSADKVKSDLIMKVNYLVRNISSIAKQTTGIDLVMKVEFLP